MRAYDAQAVGATIAVLFAITGICQLSSWLLVGVAARDGHWGLAVPWVLAIASSGLMLATREQLGRGQPPKVPAVFWVQSSCQIWWIGSVVWFASTPIALMMFFVVSSSAMNDARYLYDTPAARLSHFVPWILFPLLLLLLDALGGAGLIARAESDPAYVKYALGLLVGTALLVQFFISVVGKQCYETDAALWDRARLEAQLAEERREREVLQRSCALMVHGISAGSFSHDVASPLSLVTMAADEIIEQLATEPGTDAHRLSLSLQPAVEQLRRATSRIVDMTGALARSLRHAEEPAPMSVCELVKDALTAVQPSLARYELGRVPEPELHLADAEVFVVPGHVGAIANIVLNGALKSPAQAMQVFGRVSGPWYYRLSLRDFGVPPEERAAALAEVEASLAMTTRPGGGGVEPGSKHYGVALMLAKLLVVKHGGWLEVTAPDAGSGLVFSITLPRAQPAHIPVSNPAGGFEGPRQQALPSEAASSAPGLGS